MIRMTTVTKVWKVNPENPKSEELREAAAWLQDGRTVAFPTETVYGLGADARNTDAVARIFSAKGRPSDNPLIVHIAERSQMEELTTPPEEAVLRLMDAFWPGPLTIVLPVRPGVLSPLVTAGLSTVGIRMPDHPVASALIGASGCPVAAPSANRSGRPSPTKAEHVLDDLDGRIDGIVDGGSAGVGLESTVVEYKDGALYVLRPGGITADDLRRVLSEGVRVVETVHAPLEAEVPKAPGMKYTHYAPKGQVTIVRGNNRSLTLERMQRELDAAHASGERTGALLFGRNEGIVHADYVIVCGEPDDLASVGRELYAALRSFDEAEATFIMAEACPEEGIGTAIMNRLRKAAGGRMIDV